MNPPRARYQIVRGVNPPTVLPPDRWQDIPEGYYRDLSPIPGATLAETEGHHHPRAIALSLARAEVLRGIPHGTLHLYLDLGFTGQYSTGTPYGVHYFELQVGCVEEKLYPGGELR
jgi:hypothetical protein